MGHSGSGCLPCAMEDLPAESVVFRDDLWAAEIGPGMEVPGWYLLRTRRHAERVTGLSDAEVDVLGRRVRTLVAAVSEATGAPAVSQMVFGETHRHFHVVIAARADDVAADRRSANILKLLDEGHVDPESARDLVPKVRAAWHRLSDASRPAQLVT